MIGRGAASGTGAQIIAADAPEAISLAAQSLRAGKVIGIPTDTVYGLAAAVDRPEAVARLYELKGRAAEKAIPVLLSDPDRLDLIAAAIPPAARRLAARFWPGGLTLVLPARAGLPGALLSTTATGIRTVATRVPDHLTARAVIRAMGGQLAVTSANRSGAPPCLTAAAVAALGDAAPDLVIDGGPSPGGVPSTIVSVLDESLTILRMGAVSAAAVAAVAGGAAPGARSSPRGV